MKQFILLAFCVLLGGRLCAQEARKLGIGGGLALQYTDLRASPPKCRS